MFRLEMSMKRFLLIFPAVFAACVAMPLSAQEKTPSSTASSSGSARYQACMAKAQQYPKDAFEDAIQWRDRGGGGAAEHCAASALVTLGLYKDAAARLESLAQRIKQ